MNHFALRWIVFHTDHIAEIAIDQGEAEYGADGRRVFPNLNEEPQELFVEDLASAIAEFAFDEDFTTMQM